MLRVTVRILGFSMIVGGLFWQHSVATRPYYVVMKYVPAPVAPQVPSKHHPGRVPAPDPHRPQMVLSEEIVWRWSPMPVWVSGIVLFIFSFSPKPKFKSKAVALATTQKGGVMSLPEKWDEHQITLDISRYRSDQGLLSKYIGGITTRFVAGQDVRTIEARLKFLQTFNKYSEVARESYHWQRYLQGGRATVEEDLEDINAQIPPR